MLPRLLLEVTTACMEVRWHHQLRQLVGINFLNQEVALLVPPMPGAATVGRKDGTETPLTSFLNRDTWHEDGLHWRRIAHQRGPKSV